MRKGDMGLARSGNWRPEYNFVNQITSHGMNVAIISIELLCRVRINHR